MGAQKASQKNALVEPLSKSLEILYDEIHIIMKEKLIPAIKIKKILRG